MTWPCDRVRLQVLAAAALLAGCASPGLARRSERSVSFQTTDGWTISALYRPARKGRPLAVLVHGVGAGKDEWEPLARALWTRGFGTLALDLRGHGDSAEGPDGQRGFADFDARSEWPKAIEDLRAAQRWLGEHGTNPNRIGFIGGSIGANLSSQALHEDLGGWAGLLSPGFDYRGVTLAAAPAGRKFCVAASPGDAYAFKTALAIPDAVFLQASAGHGAQMLAEPDFLARLLDCLERAASGTAAAR